MAMNKKEQAAFDALREELRLAKALRWTEPVERDVMPPKCGDDDWNGLRNGYDFNDYFDSFSGPRVNKACTSYSSHDSRQWHKTTTQGPRPLFSTRLLALKALRHSVECKVAKILADIDKQIEDEQKGQVT